MAAVAREASGGTPVSSSGTLALVPTQAGVFVYRVSGAGELTSVAGSPFALGVSTASVWAAPSGKFAYVANQGENDISLVQIDNSTGSLKEILPRTSTGINPTSLTMDSAGSFLYVASDLPSGATISSFSVSSSSGALAPRCRIRLFRRTLDHIFCRFHPPESSFSY